VLGDRLSPLKHVSAVARRPVAGNGDCGKEEVTGVQMSAVASTTPTVKTAKTC
jgi:hypothetical protein